MKKLIFPFVMAIIVGFGMGLFMFKQYDRKMPIALTSKTINTKKASFLQIGVYSSVESMQKNLSKLDNYIYEIVDNKYHAYVGITCFSENLEKLKGYWKDMGYVIYVREVVISNEVFINELSKYDEVLSKTTNLSAIKSLITMVIDKYKEVVINGRNNASDTLK